MDELFEQFPTREVFDAFWRENYTPLTYADVQEAYEDFLKEVEHKIFLPDYEEKNAISREDFFENLNQTAEFSFQDLLTEAFYDKNPEVYETAFALYEMAEMVGEKTNVALTFHEEYNRLYREFLLEVFDRYFV